MITATRSIWDREVLRSFEQPGIDLIVLSRPPAIPVLRRLPRAAETQVRARITRNSVRQLVCSGLTSLNLDNREIAEDMIQMTTGFLGRFDAPSAELRIDVVEQRPCPKFHQDNVVLRMLITYLGPGTEYVAAEYPAQIHMAPREAIVLMKGRRHPTNRGMTLHRSPAVSPGERRLCLTVDF